jgi:hypothetical protein
VDVRAVVDGRDHAFSNIFAGTLVLGRRSATWACLAIDAESRVWIVVNGAFRREIPAADLIDSIAGAPADALFGSNDSSPIRAMVAAELELATTPRRTRR